MAERCKTGIYRKWGGFLHCPFNDKAVSEHELLPSLSIIIQTPSSVQQSQNTCISRNESAVFPGITFAHVMQFRNLSPAVIEPSVNNSPKIIEETYHCNQDRRHFNTYWPFLRSEGNNPSREKSCNFTFVENIDNEDRMEQNKTAELQHVIIPLTVAVLERKKERKTDRP
jgi:hypothetical protein